MHICYKCQIHNENLNHLLNLLINCISARSKPQILFIKVERTFLFLNFLMIGLCNFAANSLLEIFSFVTVSPEVFYQNIYKPLKQFHDDIHHISDFYQY